MTNFAILKCSAANGNLFTAHHIFLIQNDNHPVNFSLYFALMHEETKSTLTPPHLSHFPI